VGETGGRKKQKSVNIDQRDRPQPDGEQEERKKVKY
jgi:hypothetical protein